MIDERHLLVLLNLWRKNIAERDTNWNDSQWLGRVIEEINDMPKVGKWISCKEKLPNCESLRCYVTIRSEGYNVRFTKEAIWFNGEWLHENGKRFADRYIVCAWQRKWIPNPYEGE